MLLADLVATSAAVAATRARTAKREALVGLLQAAAPASDEIEAAVGFLVGAPRQGRIGIGWRTAFAVQVDAADAPSITVLELDAALTDLAATSGAGSATARQAQLARPLRSGHRAGGRLHPASAHRRAAAGSARRGDDRRGGARQRRLPLALRPPSSDALR